MLKLKSGAKRPSPFVVGIPATSLDLETKKVLQKLNPAGVILFKRNCESPEQVASLCAEISEISAFETALIFIDQEGGRVARIRWDDYIAPASEKIGEIYKRNAEEGLEAARLNGYLLASQLAPLGITANCAPVADLRFTGAHDIIGDRAFSDCPKEVAMLCGATISGMLSGGIWSTIKHAPGHGRALADSHDALPVVDVPLAELKEMDLYPFTQNKECPFVMTAHILYPQLDAENCATQSAKVLSEVVRTEMGMTGLIVADDINMKALQGSTVEKAKAALGAGCDLVLQCSGQIDGTASPEHFAQMEDMVGVAELSDEAMAKLESLPSAPALNSELVASAKVRMKELLG